MEQLLDILTEVALEVDIHDPSCKPEYIQRNSRTNQAYFSKTLTLPKKTAPFPRAKIAAGDGHPQVNKRDQKMIKKMYKKQGGSKIKQFL